MTKFRWLFLAISMYSVFCLTLLPWPVEGTTWVPIEGNVRLADGTPICAMVLANGEHMFSCDGAGSYGLTVPLDENGEITLFSFADGFAPFRVTNNPDGVPSIIQMETAAPDSPLINVSSDLGRLGVPDMVRISGDLRSNGGVPLCALVLANGQHMFSCNESLGQYDLTVPLDDNNQVTLFAFADGFQPYSQVISGDWPNHCADGRIDREVDTFNDPLASQDPWSYCCSDGDKATVTLYEDPGCSGDALAVEYDFKGPYPDGADWLIISRAPQVPEDLTDFTHLRLAVRNATTDAHHSLQIKLVNRAPDGKEYVYWVVAESVLDLPVWRVMYVDLREFTCFSAPGGCDNAPSLTPNNITRIEIGIARCIRETDDGLKECEPGANQGTLYLDELSAVDLGPGGVHRLVQTAFEQVAPDDTVSRQAAATLLEQQDSSGLCPAWFEEETPNYNTYSQALCLLVYVAEYQRTGQIAYRDAANQLAATMLAIQIPPGKMNAGAWFTAYSPFLGPGDASCTGDEVSKEDRDRCNWIGNTAWAVMSLARLQASGIFNDPMSLDTSVEQAATWMLTQRGSVPPFVELVAYGLEGNISTYFGLVAAGKSQEAGLLGDAIYNHGWDPVERRMKIGALPNDFGTAMDMAGSWGVQFLRAIGKEGEALDSLGFAATVLRTESFDDSNAAGTFVDGYGDIAGPWTMTVEFGAQAAAAGIRGADYAMQQIFLLQRKEDQPYPGSFPGSTDGWYGGTVKPWTTTNSGVAPTAWVYFALEGDPLNLWTMANPF